MDFHLKGRGGGEGCQYMEMWRCRKEVEGMRKKRKTGYRGYLCPLYRRCLALALLCNTKPTQGNCNYKILMCNGRMGFVL